MRLQRKNSDRMNKKKTEQLNYSIRIYVFKIHIVLPDVSVACLRSMKSMKYIMGSAF